MSLTVGELVARSHLRLDVLVEGDLGRVIRWVHSSDMPDPAPYLHGDEVVLTAGIWHWSGTAASAFVSGLGRAHAAALGFGTSALVRTVPAELVVACEAWGLTLFHVPDGVAFIEIVEEFVEAHVRERERPLLDSLNRSEHFLRSLQQNRGLEGVLRTLARHRRGEAAVVVRGRGVVARAGRRPLDEDVTRQAEAAIGQGAPADLRGFVAFEIPTGARDAVLVVDGALDDLGIPERATIDQAVTFLAIELQRGRAVAESERRFAAELFDLVRAGEAQYAVVAARLATFGLDPELPLVALCCESSDLEAALRTAETYLQSDGRTGTVAIKGEQLVGVIQAGRDDDVELLAADLHAALGTNAVVGAGGVALNAHGLRGSLLEARHACLFAGRRRDVGHAAHGALASHALLLALQDERVLAVFRDTLIAPLAEHDARHRTALTTTLDRFLGSGGRYAATAGALHIHVNTLRLRLARIEALTGRDLNSMEDRVDLWIALRALHL